MDLVRAAEGVSEGPHEHPGSPWGCYIYVTYRFTVCIVYDWILLTTWMCCVMSWWRVMGRACTAAAASEGPHEWWQQYRGDRKYFVQLIYSDRWYIWMGTLVPSHDVWYSITQAAPVQLPLRVRGLTRGDSTTGAATPIFVQALYTDWCYLE